MKRTGKRREMDHEGKEMGHVGEEGDTARGDVRPAKFGHRKETLNGTGREGVKEMYCNKKKERKED